jgi:hypothetical protein
VDLKCCDYLPITFLLSNNCHHIVVPLSSSNLMRQAPPMTTTSRPTCASRRTSPMFPPRSPSRPSPAPSSASAPPASTSTPTQMQPARESWSSTHRYYFYTQTALFISIFIYMFCMSMPALTFPPLFNYSAIFTHFMLLVIQFCCYRTACTASAAPSRPPSSSSSGRCRRAEGDPPTPLCNFFSYLALPYLALHCRCGFMVAPSLSLSFLARTLMRNAVDFFIIPCTLFSSMRR